MTVSKVRLFWDSVRDKIRKYAISRYPEVDETTLNQCLDDFNVEMQACIDAFSTRLAKSQKRLEENPSTLSLRRQLIKACKTLIIDPPRRGKPADISKARRQKRRLVQLYHPDANGGDDNCREQYQAVLEAFDTVEAYNQQFQQPLQPQQGERV